jgi:hypothetical protein
MLKEATLISTLAAVALGGCSSIPTHSLDEWRTAQTHHFAHTNSKDFEAAFQSVLDAAFPGKYQFRPIPNGLLAERHWTIYVVLGYAAGIEHWQVTYSPEGDGVVAQADLSNATTSAYPPPANDLLRPDNPATYELLWARIEYVLGQRQDWESCEAYAAPLHRKSIDPGQEWGPCGQSTSDAMPQRLALSH